MQTYITKEERNALRAKILHEESTSICFCRELGVTEEDHKKAKYAFSLRALMEEAPLSRHLKPVYRHRSGAFIATYGQKASGGQLYVHAFTEKFGEKLKKYAPGGCFLAAIPDGGNRILISGKIQCIDAEDEIIIIYFAEIRKDYF
jgi:hypothetical protein